jgi:hypothetical protein
MLKNPILLIFALSVVWPALAADEVSHTHPAVVVQKESGLSISDSTPDPTVKTSFSGQTWVDGVFIAQWPVDDLKNLDPKDPIEVTIKLGNKEQERLPHYDWQELSKTYIADSVEIDNPEDAIKMVFPKETAAQLLGRKLIAAQVRARFQLTDYAIGIECDAPWASAKLISADVNPTARISNEPDLGGC